MPVNGIQVLTGKVENNQANHPGEVSEHPLAPLQGLNSPRGPAQPLCETHPLAVLISKLEINYFKLTSARNNLKLLPAQKRLLPRTLKR